MEWEVVSLPGLLASAGIAYPLPGGERTRIGSLAFELSTTGGGASRQVVVQLRDGLGATIYGVGAPQLQASGDTVVYCFAPLVPEFGAPALGFMGGPLMGGWLPPNIELLVQVVSAGAGDTIDNGRMVVGQYPVIESRGEPS